MAVYLNPGIFLGLGDALDFNSIYMTDLTYFIF